jgi:hypothetical protein
MHVIVVGTEGNLRNPQLLKLRDSGFELDFSAPVYPTSAILENLGNQIINTTFLGRKLSSGEVGCWLAHDAIRKKIAERRCHEWHLVLEDDADCSFLGKPSHVLDILSRLKLSSDLAVLVNVFGQDAQNSTSSRKVRGLLAPFSGTVGYLANLNSMSATNSWGIAMTADWPLHLQSARFFAVAPPMVREIQSESLIGVSERVTSAKQFYMSIPVRLIRAVRLRVPLGFALRAILFNPALRDLTSRLRKS